ncbi:polynucleotide kinase 3 phosphatase-domain-containing protein [Lipomyces kononenkoae]|uniref:Polynucleotide kinase 3 phosphatase-domain-containing protein n=1 Tax=Lipomyces kononenkoae TaxID=34357 RepID=A0ACC3T020_LIPKO
MVVDYELARSVRYLLIRKGSSNASNLAMNRPKPATSTTSQQATLSKFFTTKTEPKSALKDANKNLNSISSVTIRDTRKRRAPEDFEFDATRTTTATDEIGDGEGITAEGTAVRNVTSVAKRSTGPIEWTVHSQSVLFGWYYDPKSPMRTIWNQRRERDDKSHTVAIAGFDLDGTLIVTKTGYSFARDANDWKFKFGESRTVKKIKAWLDETAECYSDRILVIFSNQSGIALSPSASTTKKKAKTHMDETKTRLWQFKTKLAAIMKPLGLPCYIVAATAKDDFRKPQIGMWRLVKEAYERHLQPLLESESERLDGSIEVELDTENSFFVGDAAGRKGDHSTVDKNFANNLGIRFYTPEQYFR